MDVGGILLGLAALVTSIAGWRKAGRRADGDPDIQRLRASVQAVLDAHTAAEQRHLDERVGLEADADIARARAGEAEAREIECAGRAAGLNFELESIRRQVRLA